MDRRKRIPSRPGLLAAFFVLFFVVSAQAQVGSDATITVDSTYSGYDSSVINDQVIDATGGTSTTWASAESGQHWVELEFDEARTLDFVTIHWAYNKSQGRYMTSRLVDVQIWDGSSYQQVARMAPGEYETSTTVTFGPVDTTKLRLLQPSVHGPNSYVEVMWLTEIDLGLIAETTVDQVTVDSTYSGYQTDAINDEVVEATGGSSTTWASGESTTEPHWVELELREGTIVDSATIHWAYNNYRGQYMTPQELEVQAWDGSTYRTLATHNPEESEASTTIMFSPVATTKLRFYQPAGEGPSFYPDVMWLTEIDFATVSPITADSTYPGYSIAAINDGVIDAAGGTSTTWASAESTTEPHWVELEFDDEIYIDSATIHWAYNNYRGQYMASQQVEVQVGPEHDTVATMTPAGNQASTAVNFDPVATRTLRFYQPAGQGPAVYDSVMWLAEIDFNMMREVDAAFDTDYPASDFEAGDAIAFVHSTTYPGLVAEWRWDFGDGNVSTDEYPTHTYAQAGTYVVELWAIGEESWESDSASRVFDVGGTVVDSTYSGYSDSVIDDGVIDAKGGTSATWASAESDTEPHWVELHFGEPVIVDFATIHWAYNDYRDLYMASQHVDVQMWDGSSYQTVATMNPNAFEAESTITFEPVTTTRLRFYQPAGQGPTSYDRVMWLTEIDYGLNSNGD